MKKICHLCEKEILDAPVHDLKADIYWHVECRVFIERIRDVKGLMAKLSDLLKED